MTNADNWQAVVGAVKVKPLVWMIEREDVQVSYTSEGIDTALCLTAALPLVRGCGSAKVSGFAAKPKKLPKPQPKPTTKPASSPRLSRSTTPIAELALQNAALRAQVASLTADNEALQRTVAEKVAFAEVVIQALRLHQAWSDSEDDGPYYGDQSRDTHPDGERIWRQWWDGNLSLCARAQDETRNAIAAWEAAR